MIFVDRSYSLIHPKAAEVASRWWVWCHLLFVNSWVLHGVLEGGMSEDKPSSSRPLTRHRLQLGMTSVDNRSEVPKLRPGSVSGDL